MILLAKEKLYWQLGEGADPQEIVRRYLRWLKDPASLRDSARIADLQRRSEEESLDEIELLKIYSELDRAEACDGEELESSFVACAKTFAEGEAISIGAFSRAGVSDEVLQRAGLLPKGPPKRGSSGASRASSRLKRLSRDDVIDALPSGDFKVGDLAERLGRQPGTVRAYITDLLQDGVIKKVGSKSGGRGKPANVYRRS